MISIVIWFQNVLKNTKTIFFSQINYAHIWQDIDVKYDSQSHQSKSKTEKKNSMKPNIDTNEMNTTVIRLLKLVNGCHSLLVWMLIDDCMLGVPFHLKLEEFMSKYA